jgi:hypothetical protein
MILKRYQQLGQTPRLERALRLAAFACEFFTPGRKGAKIDQLDLKIRNRELTMANQLGSIRP